MGENVDVPEPELGQWVDCVEKVRRANFVAIKSNFGIRTASPPEQSFA